MSPSRMTQTVVPAQGICCCSCLWICICFPTTDVSIARHFMPPLLEPQHRAICFVTFYKAFTTEALLHLRVLVQCSLACYFRLLCPTVCIFDITCRYSWHSWYIRVSWVNHIVSKPQDSFRNSPASHSYQLSFFSLFFSVCLCHTGASQPLIFPPRCS